MLKMLKTIFTWWNNATVGTLFFTKKRGRLVGTDQWGNKYYEETKPGSFTHKRRWVIYNGTVEGSRIPSDWHGWMHYTFDEVPSENPLPRKGFEKDHVPNLTGTSGAYRPAGSLWSGGERPRVSGDYEAWTPE